MLRSIVALLIALLVPIGAGAQATGEPGAEAAPVVRHRRPRRDRWRNTISLGFSVGGGSPLGALGMFLEYRPIRWASLSAGGGFGGTFGPAVAGSLYVDPLVVGVFGLGVGASVSHNFSWPIPSPVALPASTNWVSVEVQMQIRPSRGVFLRLGVGRAFLLDTQSFNVGTEQELDAVHLPRFPVASPVDAMYSAARGEDFAIWYVHLDVAPTWRL
ncbi:MAG: hypothetical protein WCJ30_09855 [Deltaproteobacteria bacterium]